MQFLLSLKKSFIRLQIAEEGENSKEIRDSLISTGFIEWCARHFAEPAASTEDFQTDNKPNNETELTIEFEVSVSFFELLIFQ